jgi:subtilisin family serine protease
MRLRLALAAPALVAIVLASAAAPAAPEREPAAGGAYSTLAVRQEPADPLVGDEWWRAEVGIAGLTPPGPGVQVRVVDSGLDVGHPEFAGRPNVLALNAQEPSPLGGEHGTMVSSLIGAPANNVGIVGIYPDASLASWDAAGGEGTRLQPDEIVEGLLAAARRGPGVINLSLGGPGPDPSIEAAVAFAVRSGNLVVAASGNDGERGSPLTYPAAFPHVLTVGATDRQSAVASFSTRSRYVDLAAPGTDMTVASAREQGWVSGAAGTSFSSPLVAGAAAWVWTARPDLDASQLFEVMRRSARDIETPGRDDASGFGILDVGTALTLPAPVKDPLEPNEKLDWLRSGALPSPVPPLTARGRTAATLTARLDRVEDPLDVYRVFLPKGRTFVASLTGDRDLDLTLLRGDTVAVNGATSADRLARAATRNPSTERLTLANRGAGQVAYLTVTFAPGGTNEASYRLAVTAR